MVSRSEKGEICNSMTPCSIFEKSKIPSIICNVSTAEFLIVSTYSLCCWDNSVSRRNIEHDNSALKGVPADVSYIKVS